MIVRARLSRIFAVAFKPWNLPEVRRAPTGMAHIG
jgi:hypothetical protein